MFYHVFFRGRYGAELFSLDWPLKTIQTNETLSLICFCIFVPELRSMIKPTDFQKFVLVWTKVYKTKELVPDRIT